MYLNGLNNKFEKLARSGLFFRILIAYLLIASGCSTVNNTLGTLSYVEFGYEVEQKQLLSELKKKTLIGRDCRAFLASGPVIGDILQKSSAKVMNNVVMVITSNGWGLDGCYEIYADKAPELPDASPTDFPMFVQNLGSFTKIYKETPAEMTALGPPAYGYNCGSDKSFNWAYRIAETSETPPRFATSIINRANLDEVKKAGDINKVPPYSWGLRDVTLSAFREFVIFIPSNDCLAISGTPVKWLEKKTP